MTDIARLGLAVDSSQVEKGTVSLHQLTGAAGQASAAAQRLAGASQAEAAGQKVATAAVQTHTAALAVQNNVMRSSAQQRTMMVYQLNDIAVSLASGMNPAMVAMQQGSQILQGGFLPAVRTLGSLAASLAPLLIVLAAIAALFAGLTYEINKTSAAQVSFGDVVMATAQLAAEGLMSVLGPAVSWLQGALIGFWEFVWPTWKTNINLIVGAFVFAVQGIGALWNGLPAAIGDAVIKTANIIVKGVEWSINAASRLLNGFIGKFNEGLKAMGQTPIPLAGEISIPQAANPFAGSEDRLGVDLGGALGAFGKDYVGGALDAIGKRAQDIAAARKEMEGLGGAAGAANDNVKALDDSTKALAESWGGTLKSAWQGFFSDFSNGLKQGKGVWESLGDAGLNALSKITDKALEMATSGIWDMLFGTLFGGGFGTIGKGGVQIPTGGFRPGVTGPLLPTFDGGGFTGSGPRSGGLDGKGGFRAVLHPNETVIDHTKQPAANSNSLSVVRIELSGDMEGRILEQSGHQSVQIVRAASPSIAEQGAKGAGAKLAGGDFDSSMRRFGVSAQAKRR